MDSSHKNNNLLTLISNLQDLLSSVEHKNIYFEQCFCAYNGRQWGKHWPSLYGQQFFFFFLNMKKEMDAGLE